MLSSLIYTSGFMKTELKKSLPTLQIYKNLKEYQYFFIPLSYLPFLALVSVVSLFSLLGVILRSFGVVKSKSTWLFGAKC